MSFPTSPCHRLPTKNDDGRLVYLTPELLGLLRAKEERVQILEMDLGRKVPFLFPHMQGRFEGERIRGFRKAWATACKKVGLLGRLRHDFRRTAVRNMVNAGVPERVAMKVTGHRTRAVLDRYHIVGPGDLREVAKRLASAGLTQCVCTFSGTSGGSPLDAPEASV